MIITEKQLMVLWQVFWWSLDVNGSVGGISEKNREEIANQIINQQSDKLIDIKKDDKKEVV